MKRLLYILLFTVIITGMFSSCSKESLEPTLAQNVLWEDALETSDDVLTLLNGAYNRMTGNGYYGRDFIVWGEVRSDNCFSNGWSGRFVADARMDYTDNFGGHWSEAYSVIAIANIIINYDMSGIEGDVDVLDHYLGQAYALRALAHYDLLIYYGQMHTGGTLGVPYIEEYNKEFTGQEPQARNTVSECLTKIYADIETSISLMDPALDNATKEYMTHYGAQALKARVATYFGDSDLVIEACESVINSNLYSIIPGADYPKTFLDDGTINSIFELAFSPTDNQNITGIQYIYRGSSYGDVECLEDLYLAFESGDVRATDEMIGPDPDLGAAYRPYVNLGKYPSDDYSDNIPVFRYEEVILNYAEALWRENPSDPDALTYLNMIPQNRNASSYTDINEDNILAERRKELCFEGLRFHDLARTGRDIPLVDEFNQTHGGPVYGSYNYAFPIPRFELDANRNMEQNDGY